MKTKFLFLILMAGCLAARAQTNMANVFPVLYSSRGVPLMTNAEFRCLSGERLCFRSGEANYEAFKGTDLDSNVLADLKITPKMLGESEERLQGALAQFRMNEAQGQMRLQQNLVAAAARQAELDREAAYRNSGEFKLAQKIANTSTPLGGGRLNGKQYFGGAYAP
jgi:hypothetical protein